MERVGKKVINMSEEKKYQATELADEEVEDAVGGGEIPYTEIKACNSCGTYYGENDTCCPKCGWTYWHLVKVYDPSYISHHQGPR
jgi:hypothetical protein